MRFNYEPLDWQFLSRILDENSRRMSRTRSGVSDTSASASKHPLLLDGDDLLARALENERRVHQLIFQTRSDPPPEDAADVERLLFRVADLTNEGLLPAGRLRTWEVRYAREQLIDDGQRPACNQPIPPANVPRALAEFSLTVHARWSELAEDPVSLAAWAEWHLNAGPLHPFYDGCGRISKSFSALLLVRASWLPPLYEDRATYFAAANGGPSALADYVRQRIEASAMWVAELDDDCVDAGA